MKEKFETSAKTSVFRKPTLGWFSENRTRKDQQNSVAYGQRNSISGASSRLISFKHISQNTIFYKPDILTIVIRVKHSEILISIKVKP